ncbi:MCE family protein [Nocardioides marmoriginsengisoli]|uniref:MCE family protein n=1 Tax=Nocardioides marmoriginsengisoli TaxID=661483 RepID=A0A3N0CIM5_9ACTN|nr:MlaD family protein [Nocardioides marmoriginsengisoli]RNL62793.1 MCE family protein [Nocardioides marmoriginsengisoli]
MISNLVRRQLYLFGAITVIALTVMSLNYVRIPAQLGFGRFDVDVKLSHAAGLYPKAEVTYRGADVGQVKSLDIAPGGGVIAHLQIDDGARIPADAVAQVRSASVIGEQYVNFVPPSGAGSSKVLRAGSVIPRSQTSLPTTTNEVLDAVDTFVASIPKSDLETVLDELGAAFDSSGENLGTLIDSASEVVDAANENVDETISLIDNVGPVLKTQVEMDGNLRSFVSSLDTVTGELQKAEGDLRTIFTEGSPTVRAVIPFSEGLVPVFGNVLDDVGDVGEVANAYQPALEHILTIYPAMENVFHSTFPIANEDDELPAVNLWFKLSFDPPVCTQGFEGANKYQATGDKTVRPVPADTYCKVGPGSKQVLRGARNAPCPNGAGRGAYAADCGLVFDRDEVVQQRQQSRIPALADNGMTSLFAGNTFFLQDKAATTNGPGTLQDLLMGRTR